MRSNSVSADYSVVLFKLPEEQPEPVVLFVKAGMTLTSMTSSFTFFPAAEADEPTHCRLSTNALPLQWRSGARANLRGELRD